MAASASPAENAPSYDLITHDSQRLNKIAALRGPMRTVPLFQDLAPGTIDEIAWLAQPREYAAGETLVRQGESGDELLVIMEGEARVERDGSGVATINSGDYLGEMALLDGKPRSATVIARSPISALALQRHSFDHLMDTIPPLRGRILLNLVARLRARSDTYLD
ncbi:MAG: cyclic nucleotide-binding domain-containing protein [Chloroflexota bacterium]